MVYGFISSLDDKTTKVFFRSKKIRGNNIYSAGSLGVLTSVLETGDVVYTVSCNRFASVRQVYTFARFCHERGIILHFVAEPYLDMGNGKQWRPDVTCWGYPVTFQPLPLYGRAVRSSDGTDSMIEAVDYTNFFIFS